jgi:hypothetical protein
MINLHCSWLFSNSGRALALPATAAAVWDFRAQRKSIKLPPAKTAFSASGAFAIRPAARSATEPARRAPVLSLLRWCCAG